MKISNNTVSAPVKIGGSARQGIRVDVSNASSADDFVCLNMAMPALAATERPASAYASRARWPP